MKLTPWEREAVLKGRAHNDFAAKNIHVTLLRRDETAREVSERRNNMEEASTEEREALEGVKRGRLWWWHERGRGRKGLDGQWKMYRAPWVSKDFCFGISGGSPSCLWALKAKLPCRVWAWLEGIAPAPSAPQWAPLPAQVLAMWWYLWLSPFLLPAALTVPVAAFASCYIMLLFSTCDSIRYLIFLSTVFW